MDFFCPKAKLAVEVDGSQHGTGNGLGYDQERAAILESMGIAVIRFGITMCLPTPLLFLRKYTKT